jgi:hypothetical protein
MTYSGENKISVGLSFGLHPMFITPNGVEFNAAFKERLVEKEKFFQERIVEQINAIAGTDWALHFTEVPVNRPSFLVDILASQENYGAIMNIVSSAFPDTQFSFWRPGPPFQHLGTIEARS